MRILHTSDWHMNERLGGVDRSDDILRALERVASYLDERGADVLLVTGDLFSERSGPEKMRKALSDLGGLFLPFLERGGTMIAISGNHDSEVFFDTVAETLNFAAPVRSHSSDVSARGRLYATSRPGVLRLQDRDGVRIDFVLVPFPTASRYLRGPGASYGSFRERNAAIHAAALDELARLRAERSPGVPSVLAAHVHVRGASLHTLYKLKDGEDVIFDPESVGTDWAYVAYGHIHKPQPIGGSTFARYAGSVERLHIDERDDEKSAVLVEIGPDGPTAEPELLPIAASVLRHVEIEDPAEIETLADRYPDRDTTLVRYALAYEPGVHDVRALTRRVEAVFPRWYERQLKPSRVELGDETSDGSDQRLDDVRGTVETYFERKLATHPNRARLLEIAHELIDAEVPA